MQGPDNGSNSWQLLPINYYFADSIWRYASIDISQYKTQNVKFKITRGGFCGTFLEQIDNIRVFERDCQISNLACGPITGESNISANTNYTYSVDPVQGAVYYKWYVRSGGKLYDLAPYIVSGQGTRFVTANYGNLPGPLRILCLPFDTDLSALPKPADYPDACYAKIAYKTMITCTPVTASVYVTASDSSICEGTQVNFTATPGAGITNPSYQWKINGSNVGTNSKSFSSSSIKEGDLVTVQISSSDACVTGSPASASAIKMSVTPKTASVSISTPTTSACAGTEVTFNATPVNGGSSPTYQWKINGSNVGSNSPTFSSTNLQNNDIVTLVMTSSESCTGGLATGSNPVTFTVLPASASVSISASSNSICSGTQVNFTATPFNGGSAPVYQWKVNGNNTGTNSPTFSSGQLNNNDVVSVVMTSNSSCANGFQATSNTILMAVTETLKPAVSISTNSTNVCLGANVSFTAIPSGGGPSPSYQWKVNGLNVGTNSPIFYTTNLNNNDLVSVTMTSNAPCTTGSSSASSSLTMNVIPQETALVNITASQTTICPGSTVYFTAKSSGGGSSPAYQWKINGMNVGTNSANFSSNTLNNNDVVTVEMTTSSPCATGSPAKSNVIVISLSTAVPAPVSISATKTVICEGTNVVFTATPVNGGQNPSYQWQLNGKNVGTNSNTYESNTLKNSDSISVIMTSSADCVVGSPSKSNIIVMLVGSKVYAGVITADRDTVCELGRAKLLVTGSIGNIQWQSAPAGEGYKDIIGAKSAILSVIVYKTTQYRVFATNGICSDTSQPYTIHVVPQPQGYFTHSFQDRTVTFNSGSSTGKIVRYFWSFNDNDTSAVANPVHTYAEDGSYYVCLTVYDRYNCYSTYCNNVSLGGLNGIESYSHEQDFRMYPNPFDDHILYSGLTAGQKIKSIQIFNLAGARIYMVSNPAVNGFIPTQGLEHGVYFLNIETDAGCFRKMMIKP